jgi:hypothetical protein
LKGLLKMNFDDFIMSVAPQYQGFAQEINSYLLQNGCMLKMAQAKNGLVVSYQHPAKKRVLMNFVFRKKGLVARVYGEHVGEYPGFLESMPDSMRASIQKAPPCKRFDDPPKCSPKCSGYVFSIDGTQYQKCRYNCFMYEVNDESIPFITAHIEKELAARPAGGAGVRV